MGWATGRALGEPLAGHTDGVTSCAFSPDGKLIVSGSLDNTLRLWEVRTGRCLTVLQWHQAINTVAMVPPRTDRRNKLSPGGSLSPEDDVLAFGDAAGTISFWAVSRTTAAIRFLGMPPHNAMPLWFEGASLRGCRMDPHSKRLLAQSRGEVNEVLVEQAKLSSSSLDLSKSKPPSANRDLLRQATILIGNLEDWKTKQQYWEKLDYYHQQIDRLTETEQKELQALTETLNRLHESQIVAAKARRATLPSHTAPLKLPQSSTTKLTGPSLPSPPKDTKSVESPAKRGLFSLTRLKPWLSSVSSPSKKSQPPATAYPQFFSAPTPEQKFPPGMKTPLLTTGALLKQAQALLNTACPSHVPARADLRHDFLQQLAEYKEADLTKPPTLTQQQSLQSMMQLLRDIQGQSSSSQVTTSNSTTYSSSST